MESSHEVEARAGAWLAKRESGNWSADDEARFTQWLNASTGNRVAFLRQEGAWEHASRLRALKGDTAPGTLPAPESWRLNPFVSDGSTRAAGTVATTSRRWRLPATLVASVVLAIAAGALFWHLSNRGPYYRTPVGGLASVPMKDGSKVTLNTDSAIRVALTVSERRVELERGEVFFEVAKDPGRPFVVSAGNKRVVAVGTKFSVHRIGNDLQVFVTEGKVRLEGEGASAVQAATNSRGKSNEMLLVAGTITRAADSGVIVQQKPLTEVEDYLSWRVGYLTFRDIPLADAVAEFNRYNERKIFIRDARVGEIRFSGKVRPTSFEGFVRLLEDAFPVRAAHENDRIVLTAAQ